MSELARELTELDVFQGLADEQLEWPVRNGDIGEFSASDYHAPAPCRAVRTS